MKPFLQVQRSKVLLAGASQKAGTSVCFLPNSSHWPGASLHIFSR